MLVINLGDWVDHLRTTDFHAGWFRPTFRGLHSRLADGKDPYCRIACTSPRSSARELREAFSRP
jgi:hypothetical protein